MVIATGGQYDLIVHRVPIPVYRHKKIILRTGISECCDSMGENQSIFTEFSFFPTKVSFVADKIIKHALFTSNFLIIVLVALTLMP